ncbi:MAG: hypothetical protein H8E37_00755, partial [Planctomycetes bacterium]|nr:hypothetical protein [Planctomycetota bacterium]
MSNEWRYLHSWGITRIREIHTESIRLDLRPDHMRPVDPEEQSRKNAATLLALVGMLFSGLALLGLAALVLPDILKIFLVLAGLIGVGVLQYVTWGWMLDRNRIDDDDE